MLTIEEVNKIYTPPPTMALEKRTNANKTKRGFKQKNIDKVISIIKKHEKISSIDLCKKANLSDRTVSKMMAMLISDGGFDKFVIQNGRIGRLYYCVVS